MTHAVAKAHRHAAAEAPQDVVAKLGFGREIARLRHAIAVWVDHADRELHELLRWQFAGGAKHYRPLTIFSCHRAREGAAAMPEETFRAALAIEIFHNMTLIVDDILDESEERRGRQTLHTRFGNLPALMASGYVVAEVFRLMEDDPHAIRLFSELLSRLGVAECIQWRLRRQPLDVEDWRRIAGEDTGSMFEICACLGDPSERLRTFGHLLGVLYHGCDDVGDVRGGHALGGGGYEDLRDGILTLPAALAIRDPVIAAKFSSPAKDDLPVIEQALSDALPEAEIYLDGIASEAKREAHLFAADPDPLLALVDHTRQLARR
jgi:geranylgeranyl pyrophosphate synthase